MSNKQGRTMSVDEFTHSEFLRKAAIEKLTELATNGDTEAAHADADKVLTDLLTALGYGDVVEAWDAVDKWYA